VTHEEAEPSSTTHASGRAFILHAAFHFIDVSIASAILAVIVAATVIAIAPIVMIAPVLRESRRGRCT
jgi:hypothetical protein